MLQHFFSHPLSESFPYQLLALYGSVVFEPGAWTMTTWAVLISLCSGTLEETGAKGSLCVTQYCRCGHAVDEPQCTQPGGGQYHNNAGSADLCPFHLIISDAIEMPNLICKRDI